MRDILQSFARELTHYFQYVNGIPRPGKEDDRQVRMYADEILEDYGKYLKKKSESN